MRATLLILAAVATGSARADDDKKPQPTEAVKKWDAVLGDTLAYLKKNPRLTLVVTTTWKATHGDKEHAGKSHVKFTTDAPDRFRLECSNGGDDKAELICVSDGKTLTRLLPRQGWYNRVETKSPRAELFACSLTATALEGSALDVLLHPDLADLVHAQATGIEYLGTEDVDGKCHHFKFTWGGKRKVDLWVASEGDPVVKRLDRAFALPLREKDVLKMTTSATLAWKVGADSPKGTFAVELPRGARKVNDLLNTLTRGDTDSLLGKPAPVSVLAVTDGKTVKLSEHKGKDVVVLFFWATWCTPSVEDLAALGKIVGDYQAKGVTFYAVNVGEKAASVKQFLAKQPLKSTVVLDADGKLAEAFGVTALPLAVLIGKDGTVQGTLRGKEKEVLERFAADLDRLLKGESLIPSP